MRVWLLVCVATGCAGSAEPAAPWSRDLGVVEAAVGEPCGDLTTEGCCDGDDVRFCDGGVVGRLSCKDGCGWDGAKGWYDCGQSGADPSGDHPLSCPGGCVAACAGKACGDDGCGGSCGSCSAGEACSDGACTGDPCATMPAGGQCNRTTLRWCEGGTLHTYDCAKQQKTCGYDPAAGASDCLGTGGCTPSCAERECGSDGCGGSCGKCGDGEACVAGSCEGPACQPDCADRECGDDGCGGLCGTCPEGECEDGVCEAAPTCTPTCAGKQCGPDGCGGVCGTCPGGYSCTGGTCLEPTPLGGGGGLQEPGDAEEPAEPTQGCGASAPAAPWALLLLLRRRPRRA
ncbi:MAG: hypothetical protein AMXMBFR64_16330 [Myxococcales bacterium]